MRGKGGREGTCRARLQLNSRLSRLGLTVAVQDGERRLSTKHFFYFSNFSFIFLYINFLFHLSLAQNHRVPISSARSLITSFAPPQAPSSPFHPEAKRPRSSDEEDKTISCVAVRAWNGTPLLLSPSAAQASQSPQGMHNLRPNSCQLGVSTRITSNLSFSVSPYLIRFLFLQNTNKLGLCQATGLQMLRGECGLEVLGKGES